MTRAGACAPHTDFSGVGCGSDDRLVTQFNYRFTSFAGRGGHIYLQLNAAAKNWYVCIRSRRRSLLNNIGLGLLTSSVVLIASTLCLQAAIVQQAPTDNKGLKAVELRSVDFSSEIDSVRGRRLRLRLLTLEPGGVVELHSNKDHPTILHVIKGTLTSHPQGKPAVVLRAGVGFAEGKDSNYWVQNTGSEPAEFIWLPVYESAP